MPRTMTSTASGKALRNLFSRRFFKNDSSQRGKPKAPAKAMATAASRPAPLNKPDHEEKCADDRRR